MHVQFAELPVSDQDRAKAFYVEMFGCEVIADVPMSEDGWRWIEVRLPGAQTNLHFTDRKGEPQEDPVLVFIDKEVGAAVETLRGKGVEIVTEPEPAPYDPSVIAAVFVDSEGNRLVISTG